MAQARGTGVIGSLNLILKFLLELCALAAFAYAASQVGHGLAVATAAAVAAPLLAALAWGRYAAPAARHRLAMPWRAGFELAVFILAAAALAAVHQAGLAIAFIAVVALNALALTLLRQWEH